MKLKIPTKRKIPNKDQTEDTDPAENGHDETKQTESSSSVNLSDTDKEKGKFSNFSISKNTIQKLKGRSGTAGHPHPHPHSSSFISARNVEFLFPVQAESYKHIHDGKDCLVQAYTGTGKTLAFSIPIVELLQNDSSLKLLRGRAPRVLALAPTRELSEWFALDNRIWTKNFFV